MAFADRRQTGHIGNPKRTLTSRSAGSVPERWTLANAAMKLTALGNNYYGDCVVAAWLHQAQAQAFYTYGVHYDPASLPAGLDQHGPRSFTVTGSGGAHVPLQSDISSWISQYSLGGEGDTIVTWWAANFPNIINTQWSPAYADAMRIYRNTPNYKIGPKEGRFNSDVASYISTNGIGTQGYHRIYADAISTTPDSVKQAIYFLGGAVMALNLPDSITKQRSWRLVSGADAKPGGFGSHDHRLQPAGALRRLVGQGHPDHVGVLLEVHRAGVGRGLD